MLCKTATKLQFLQLRHDLTWFQSPNCHIQQLGPQNGQEQLNLSCSTVTRGKRSTDFCSLFPKTRNHFWTLLLARIHITERPTFFFWFVNIHSFSSTARPHLKSRSTKTISCIFTTYGSETVDCALPGRPMRELTMPRLLAPPPIPMPPADGDKNIVSWW